MKYKIYRHIKFGHKLNPKTKLYEETKEEEYRILRKGTIVGLWHTVGDWSNTTDLYDYNAKFDSPEQAKSYLKCWHNEHYLGQPIELV